jgi:hypothetical protein
MKIDLEKLDNFLETASAATYAGGGKYEKTPEREGFNELVYVDGDWHYRDSYVGFARSWGTELVRYRGKPVWNALYGGGIVGDNNELAKSDFAFLIKALSNKPKEFRSFRGPGELKDGEWLYTYTQEGDVGSFVGYEEIKYKGNLVFWHRVIGGVIKK